MQHSEQNKRQPTIPADHSLRIWLLAGVLAFLLLTGVAIFFAPQILTSPSIKQKIQAAVTEKTGGRLNYQAIDLRYFPRLAIELQGVNLAVPEQVQGTIASLRITPKLLPLLTGDWQLAALKLDKPQLILALPAGKADKIPAQSLALTVLKENMARVNEAAGPMLSGLKVTINNAQLTLTQGKRKLATLTGLSLQSDITGTKLSITRVKIKTTIVDLNIYRQGHRETIKDIALNGSVKISGDTIIATVDQLALGKPNLALTGELIFAPTTPNLRLNLSGSDIDVAASCATALALAGDITPVKKIFKYLHGGRVPQITFSTHGENVSGLGTLDNIVIKGQLQDGWISIPEVKLELTELVGDVVISEGILQGSKLSTRLKNSTAKNGSLQIGLTKNNNLFLLELALNADLAEVYPWLISLKGLQGHLQEVQQVSGRIDMSSLKLQGKLNTPSAWEISSTGSLNNLSIVTEHFPDTINLASGEFVLSPELLSFKKLKATSRDAALTLAGNAKGFPRQLDRIDLTLNGDMGAKCFAWLSTQLTLPNVYMIHTPFNIKDTKISWQPDSTLSFKGLVSIENGPAITADVDFSPNRLQVHQLTIKDRYSDAAMIFNLVGDRRDGRFTGSLQHKTLQTLFVDTAFNIGRLEGDLAVSIPPTGQAAVTAKGQLASDKLPIVLPSGDKVDIDHVMLQGDGSDIGVDIARMTWEDLSWAPVKAMVSLNGNRTDIKFVEARLCGIDSSGTISTTGNTFSVDMALTGQNLDVANSYTCLTKGRVKMTGSLDFSSKIIAREQVGRLVNGMQGPLQMTFSNGLIEQDKMLSRVLEAINIKEMIKFSLPKLTNNGFAYKTMTLVGQFQNGRLTIDKYYMDGETLDLIGKGEINLAEGTVDMQLLAVPFQTANNLVKHIPGVNYLLADGLVSIPVSVSGTLTDPKVRVSPVSAVSSNLFNLAKRTIESPIKLIDTLNPWNKIKK